MKKLVIGLLAAMALSWAQTAYADNDTEFGIEDDLTVLGTGGSATPSDPDMEVKGFTVFGSTQTSYTGLASPAAGDVVVNGYLAVSSGAYFVGRSTFAAGGAYFTGVSSFSSPANIYVGGTGATGQVLKKAAGGGMEWLDDSVGLNDTSMGNPRFLQMPNAGQTALEDSKLYQNANNSITVMDASSMTVTGALGVDGAAKLNGDITLGDTSADLLTMNAQATFVGGSTFTTGGVYFTGISSFSSPSNIYVGGTGVAGQVLKKAAGGGMQWSDDQGGVSGGGTVNYLPLWKPDGATLGDAKVYQAEVTGSTHVYIGGPSYFDVDSTNGNTSVGGTLGAAGAATFHNTVKSSGTFTVGEANEANFTVNAADGNTSIAGTLGVTGVATLSNNLIVDGNAKLGNAVTDAHAINRAVDPDVALSVDSDGTAASGKFAAKFYSGGSLAAWIKKK